MRKLVLFLTIVGTSALAHQGVKNPAVMARMNVMTDIASDTKTLGQMATGQVAFDAEAARLAAEHLVSKAAQVKTLFAAPETDPKSEARAEIWLNFSDFEREADAMEAAARAIADDPGSLKTGFRTLGATCQSCHQSYRIKN